MSATPTGTPHNLARDFRRRRYSGPGELIRDVRAVWRERHQMPPLMRGVTISQAFRERLMLVVTEVNACRYCSYFHARQALVEGLSRGELETLAAGDFDASPPEERPALLYAQHWAESDGQPEQAARYQLDVLYGAPTAKAIDLALRVIRIGNLTGNTFDYLLFRVSGGRWGG